MFKQNQQLVFVVLLLSVNMFYVVASKNVSHEARTDPNSPTPMAPVKDLNQTAIFIDDLNLKSKLNIFQDKTTNGRRSKSENLFSDKWKNISSSHELTEGKNKNQEIVDNQNNLFQGTNNTINSTHYNGSNQLHIETGTKQDVKSTPASTVIGTTSLSDESDKQIFNSHNRFQIDTTNAERRMDNTIKPYLETKTLIVTTQIAQFSSSDETIQSHTPTNDEAMSLEEENITNPVYANSSSLKAGKVISGTGTGSTFLESKNLQIMNILENNNMGTRNASRTLATHKDERVILGGSQEVPGNITTFNKTVAKVVDHKFWNSSNINTIITNNTPDNRITKTTNNLSIETKTIKNNAKNVSPDKMQFPKTFLNNSDHYIDDTKKIFAVKSTSDYEIETKQRIIDLAGRKNAKTTPFKKPRSESSIGIDMILLTNLTALNLSTNLHIDGVMKSKSLAITSQPNRLENGSKFHDTTDTATRNDSVQMPLNDRKDFKVDFYNQSNITKSMLDKVSPNLAAFHFAPSNNLSVSNEIPTQLDASRRTLLDSFDHHSKDVSKDNHKKGVIKTPLNSQLSFEKKEIINNVTPSITESPTIALFVDERVENLSNDGDEITSLSNTERLIICKTVRHEDS